MESERLAMLAKIATWYYEQNMSQDVIGARIGRSRSMVSRFLQEAREQGLIEIRVHYPLKTNAQIEHQLCETFGLSHAYVLADCPRDYSRLLRRLGELAAQHLQAQLRNSIHIGISWGTGVYEVVRAVSPAPLRDVLVIQIIGAVSNSDPMIDGVELARWLAEKMGGTYRSIFAPLVVDQAEIAQGLLQDRTIAEVVDLARSVDIALVGVGVLDPPELTGLWRAGYVSEQELLALKKAGAVGELIAYPLDIWGQVVDCSLTQRSIGVDLETLATIPLVIAIAGGERKAPALLGALRTGCLDVLVTDAIAAAAVLHLHEQGPQSAGWQN